MLPDFAIFGYTDLMPSDSLSFYAAPAGNAVHPYVQAVMDSGMIPASILQPLLQGAQGDPEALEKQLMEKGFADEKQLQALKAKAYGWEFVDLGKEFISDELLSLIPKGVAQSQQAVPFAQDEKQVRVAMLKPGNARLRRILQKKFGREVKLYLASPSALQSELAKYDTEFHQRFSSLGNRATKQDDSVIELFNALIQHGLTQRASDIHIEPGAHQAAVRERIDGLLRASVSFSKEIHGRLMQRMKVMANLATDEHSMPQDGKLVHWTPDKRRVDVRVSIVPVTHGEKAVLRLLPEQADDISLDTLGCAGRNRQLIEEQSKMSWGMILITGPTGSGKSTTLYSILKQLAVPSVNVSTIEDPVEYELAGASQIQVNEKTGLTFADGLRALLRQDPNVILVGEIRDRETAGIAVNAAMTGHLVLSTLHTNNAATAIPRLLDMQIEPFLIASVVNLVAAQRLVRKNCQDCIEWTETPTEGLRNSLTPDVYKLLETQGATLRMARGKGCDKCNGTGFHGRTGIYEVLAVDATIRKLILQKETADTIEQEAIKNGMTTLVQDGLNKVIAGITTIEEFLRVIRT